jgi:hypothetical protein
LDLQLVLMMLRLGTNWLLSLEGQNFWIRCNRLRMSLRWKCFLYYDRWSADGKKWGHVDTLPST